MGVIMVTQRRVGKEAMNYRLSIAMTVLKMLWNRNEENKCNLISKGLSMSYFEE